MLTLLQSAGPSPSPAGASADAERILVILGLLIVLVFLLGLLAIRMRKRLLGDDAPDGTPPLLLEELRAMARRGEISQAEFELMRRRMVEHLSGPSGTPLSVSGRAARGPMNVPPTVEKPAGHQPPPAPERRAAPGVDLTGEPLPRPKPGE